MCHPTFSHESSILEHERTLYYTISGIEGSSRDSMISCTALVLGWIKDHVDTPCARWSSPEHSTLHQTSIVAIHTLLTGKMLLGDELER